MRSEKTEPTRIEDLSAFGRELSEEDLRLVVGARRRTNNTGTCTWIATYIWDRECVADSDED
jgi:hypothetical protein